MSWCARILIFIIPVFLWAGLTVIGLIMFRSKKGRLPSTRFAQAFEVEVLVLLLGLGLLFGNYFFQPLESIRVVFVPIFAYFFVTLLLLGTLLVFQLRQQATDGLAELRGSAKLTLLILLGLFGLSVFLKVAFFLKNSFFYVIWDEFAYIDNAWVFISGRIFSGQQLITHYPPLYPVLISPAFVFGGDFFRNIQILNAIYSSFLVVLIYLILKLYVDNKMALAGAFLSVLLPFHYFFPRQVYSENVFIPLLFLLIYVLLKPSGLSIRRTVFFGVLLSAIYLTRYIALIVLPVFILLWSLRIFEKSNSVTMKKHLVILLYTIMLIFGVWILYGLLMGNPVKSMIGFHVTGDANSSQLTFIRFLYWTIKVLAFSVLLTGPFIYPLVIFLHENFPAQLFTRNWTGDIVSLCGSLNLKNRLFLVFSGLTAAFWVSIIRHHMRVDYNFPHITRFVSRYLAFLVPLAFILAWIGIDGLIKSKTRGKWGLLVISVIILVFSYALVFQIPFFSISPFTPETIRILFGLNITLYLSNQKLLYLAGLVLMQAALLLKMDHGKLVYQLFLIIHMLTVILVGSDEVAKYQKVYFTMRSLHESAEPATNSKTYLYVEDVDGYLEFFLEDAGRIAVPAYWELILGEKSEFSFMFSENEFCEVGPDNSEYYFLLPGDTLEELKWPEWTVHATVNFEGESYVVGKVDCNRIEIEVGSELGAVSCCPECNYAATSCE